MLSEISPKEALRAGELLCEDEALARFDGIICIGGEDWWYHNRGHFDFQIMRRLAHDWPVLFVNSLGVRMPSLSDNKLFMQRISRKLKSLAQGLHNVEHKFWVFSPVTVPGEKGQKLSKWALAPQIKLAALRAGIRRPLLWVHCPAGAALLDDMGQVATILQRTDRFEAFPEADGDLVARQIAVLKRAADLVVYAAPHLMVEEIDEVRRSVLVTHGVDLSRFAQAAAKTGSGPADVALLPKPRIGFIGGIDDHTFDVELFLAVARALPDCQFVLVGGCSLPEGWCDLENVTLLGRKPYEAVAHYMAAMDVLIMPWNSSEWIKACNPIKLKEYLAVGKPIVTRDFAALAPWRDMVHVADDAAQFVAAIRQALEEEIDPSRAQELLACETWDAKAQILRQTFQQMGLSFLGGEVKQSAGKAHQKGRAA